MSGIFGVWCVGCMEVLSALHDGTEAYKKVAERPEDHKGSHCWQEGLRTVCGQEWDCETEPPIHWSEPQHEWCCEHRRKGCSDQELEEHDCLTGFLHWHTAWSPSRKEWCCEHRNLGCEEEDSAVDTQDSQWGQQAARWSQAATLSAQAAAQKPEHDCAENLLFWKQLWTFEHKRWCCAQQQLGCYDCSGEPAVWSPDQLEWCCRSRGVGCE